MTTAVSVLGAAGWLVLTFGAAWTGSRFMPDEWYRRLKKPAWNPPDSVFAPVWTVLYLLMASAVWLIWRRYGIRGALLPIILYVAQLILNAAWTWLFFGRHRVFEALIDVVLLWFMILLMIISFSALEIVAGLVLIPYLAWVSFAAVLNWKIWRINLL